MQDRCATCDGCGGGDVEEAQRAILRQLARLKDGRAYGLVSEPNRGEPVLRVPSSLDLRSLSRFLEEARSLLDDILPQTSLPPRRRRTKLPALPVEVVRIIVSLLSNPGRPRARVHVLSRLCRGDRTRRRSLARRVRSSMGRGTHPFARLRGEGSRLSDGDGGISGQAVLALAVVAAREASAGCARGWVAHWVSVVAGGRRREL